MSLDLVPVKSQSTNFDRPTESVGLANAGCARFLTYETRPSPAVNAENALFRFDIPKSLPDKEKTEISERGVYAFSNAKVFFIW